MKQQLFGQDQDFLREREIVIIFDPPGSTYIHTVVEELYTQPGIGSGLVRTAAVSECIQPEFLEDYIGQKVLFMLFPFSENASTVPAVHDFINRCEALKLPLILMDDPTLYVPQHYADAVVRLYKRAINLDYGALSRRNRQVQSILLQGTSYRLRSSLGTDLKFTRDREKEILMENCQFSEHEHLFQLPGGEVFFAPQPYTAQGELIYAVAGGLRVSIQDGMAYFSSGEYQGIPVPLAEFGIGTNADLANLRFMPSYEKLWGTCHLGFGHNRNMQGVFERAYHFDIVLESFTLSIDGKSGDFYDS